MVNNMRDFYIISIGFVLIVLGGIAHILEGMIFWYLLGFITVPFVSAWIRWSNAKIDADRAKSAQ